MVVTPATWFDSRWASVHACTMAAASPAFSGSQDERALLAGGRWWACTPAAQTGRMGMHSSGSTAERRQSATIPEKGAGRRQPNAATLTTPDGKVDPAMQGKHTWGRQPVSAQRAPTAQPKWRCWPVLQRQRLPPRPAAHRSWLTCTVTLPNVSPGVACAFSYYAECDDGKHHLCEAHPEVGIAHSLARVAHGWGPARAKGGRGAQLSTNTAVWIRRVGRVMQGALFNRQLAKGSHPLCAGHSCAAVV